MLGNPKGVDGRLRLTRIESVLIVLFSDQNAAPKSPQLFKIMQCYLNVLLSFPIVGYSELFQVVALMFSE